MTSGRRRTWVAPVIAVAAVAALLAGCGGSSSSSSKGGGGSSSGSGGGASGSPVVIGASLSLSGDFSADGTAFERGYKLWAADIN